MLDVKWRGGSKYVKLFSQIFYPNTSISSEKNLLLVEIIFSKEFLFYQIIYSCSISIGTRGTEEVWIQVWDWLNILAIVAGAVTVAASEQILADQTIIETLIRTRQTCWQCKHRITDTFLIYWNRSSWIFKLLELEQQTLAGLRWPLVWPGFTSCLPA